MTVKRILITGGAGFIGSNFIRYLLLLRPDYKIVNLDKLTYAGNLENLKEIEKHRNYEFVKGDIADEKIVGKLAKGCDCIINFAAETHVDRSINDPVSFIRTNVFGTYTLLEAARVNRTKRFIQISTDEVYGSIETGEFTEMSPLEPNSPYSASKASGDMLARSYWVTYHLPVIITRSSNNFGPYQFPEKVMPLFITNLIDNKKIPLYADGSNVRDWLFVADNCEGIEVVLEKGVAGEVYNIGGGNEVTNLVLTHAILDKLKKGRELIQYVADRPGHDKRYALDISKMRGLGWAPRHDFTQALSLTVDWYVDHEEWWRPLKKG